MELQSLLKVLHVLILNRVLVHLLVEVVRLSVKQLLKILDFLLHCTNIESNMVLEVLLVCKALLVGPVFLRGVRLFPCTGPRRRII